MKKFFIIFIMSIFYAQVWANDDQDTKVTISISDQLKTLQDLYKSGVLSGYEYEEEKKRILDK